MHFWLVSSQQNPPICTLRSGLDVWLWPKKLSAATLRSARRITQVGEWRFFRGANCSGEETLRRQCRVVQLNTTSAGCKHFKGAFPFLRAAVFPSPTRKQGRGQIPCLRVGLKKPA